MNYLQCIHSKLLTEIDSFKSSTSQSKPNDDGKVQKSGDSNHITYQLYYKPEQAKFINNVKVIRKCLYNVYIDNIKIIKASLH